MNYWGLFALSLVLVICVAAVSGCAQPPVNSFRATCAVLVIGKTEQGITVVKQACEVE